MGPSSQCRACICAVWCLPDQDQGLFASPLFSPMLTLHWTRKSVCLVLKTSKATISNVKKHSEFRNTWLGPAKQFFKQHGKTWYGFNTSLTCLQLRTPQSACQYLSLWSSVAWRGKGELAFVSIPSWSSTSISGVWAQTTLPFKICMKSITWPHLHPYPKKLHLMPHRPGLKQSWRQLFQQPHSECKNT